jgi:hypothetical protein
LARPVMLFTCFGGLTSVELGACRKSETRVKEKFHNNIEIGSQRKLVT